LKEIDGLRMERGVLSPSRPLLTRSALPISFLERLSAGGWREAPAESLSGKPGGKRLQK
jgi:hypothetical protein